MVFYRYFQDISKVNVLKVLKKVNIEYNKGIKIEDSKDIKMVF